GLRGDGGPASRALFANPQFVATDAAGNLYISDNGNGRIRKVGTDGLITSVESVGSPFGVAVDASGNLYVAHSSPRTRVRKVSLDGTITTVAGGGNQPLTEGAIANTVAL